jgi:dihydroorotase
MAKKNLLDAFRKFYMSLLIKNGHVIDPVNDISEVLDVLIQEGKITKIGKNLEEKAEETIDAKNLIVTPGLIDLQVHFREPGREDRETIETGSRAALKGGITSVVTMPNTTPVADNQSVISHILKRNKEVGLINIFPSGATTKGQQGKTLAEMWEIQQAGGIAVTEDGFDVQNEGLLLKAFEYAKTHDILVMSHCEVENLSGMTGLHEGWVSTQMGLEGSPEVSEDLAVVKNIMLAEKVGNRLHLLHNSTKGAMDAIREAKKRGAQNITAEVSVQHFALTDEVALGYNTNAKMYPPLRSQPHVNAVIEAIKEGYVDCFTTDHAPHIEPDKIKPFQDAAFGSIGVETSFAVANTYLVEAGYISLETVISKMTIEPAKIIRVDKGHLSVGVDADIAIIDAQKKWKVDAQKAESKSKNCVFDGYDLVGKTQHVVVGGVVKMRDEEIVG